MAGDAAASAAASEAATSAPSSPAAAASAAADVPPPSVFDTSKLQTESPLQTPGLMWQMLAAVAVIMVLAGLAFIVVKKVLPKIGRPAGKRIRLLETIYIQPRKALHLVQVGSRKLLIASSPETLVRIDDVTDAIAPDYAETAKRIEEESKDAERTSEQTPDTAR